MTIHGSGIPIYASEIQAEFGGGNPMYLSNYYAGGPYVPAGTVGEWGAIPTSGYISLGHFYGASNYVPPPVIYNGNVTWAGSPGGIIGYSFYEGLGSISPDTFAPLGGPYIYELRFTGGQLDFGVIGNYTGTTAWTTMSIQNWGTVRRDQAGFTYIGGATNESRWRWVGQANPFVGPNPLNVQFT